ncbi:hypothetical protein HMI54_015005 [Coelomomyces lativittatus]|nr:hypothetical protein HMI56_004789 [Coelomomyces lativittatus]KAJ1513446.1 hypothetical protein HMI54_015005 [Coelomomyces lativittatus]KAJ1515984.1 hypothetical protein HMI55_003180 [Coelomomyces lativittatus]
MASTSNPFVSTTPSSSTLSFTRKQTHVSPYVFPCATLVLIGLSSFLHGLHVSLSPIPYITTKTSWLNVVLGKYSWFWTSVVYAWHLYSKHSAAFHSLFQSTSGSFPFSFSFSRSCSRSLPVVTASLIRYGLATLYWFLVTQWCFGPSWIDWITDWVGGTCTPHPGLDQREMCLAHQGVWKKAHDVSGHCVVLHHAYLFLMHEEDMDDDDEEKGGNPTKQRVGSFWRRGLCAVWVGLTVITVFYYHHSLELIHGVVLGSLFSVFMYGFKNKSKHKKEIVLEVEVKKE